jgi:hypothetical protein
MIEDFLEESWSYQEMVQKGIDKGIELGRKQRLELSKKLGIDNEFELNVKMGELKALRSTLVRIVEIRFPELTALAQQQVEHFTIPELLRDVIDKLLSLMAQTTDRARQVLMELDTPHPDA